MSMIIGPDVYASWRATTLGQLTEAIEQRLILKMLGELSGRCMLDVGCGDGTLARVAASRGAFVTGIDSDPAMLAVARARTRDAEIGASFLEGRVEHLPFPDASFDVVAAITVMCFVPGAAGAVREMARVLRPGGRLVIGELGRYSSWAAMRRVRGWFNSPTWKAARFRSAAELRDLAEQAGLSVIEVSGAVYYPPIPLIARVLAPLDPWFGRRTTLGAAFVALTATRERR